MTAFLTVEHAILLVDTNQCRITIINDVYHLKLDHFFQCRGEQKRRLFCIIPNRLCCFGKNLRFIPATYM